MPPEHAQNLWGVGFFHRESRDALIALWLEHSVEGFDQIQHGGAPTLHYDGHGQLWSRYPANKAEFRAGTSFRQKNAYTVFPYSETNGASEVEQLRHRLINPLTVQSEELPKILVALNSEGLRIHAFGLSLTGLAKVSNVIASADSMVWSFVARRRRIKHGRCRERHLVCNNCLSYALSWRREIMSRLISAA